MKKGIGALALALMLVVLVSAVAVTGYLLFLALRPPVIIEYPGEFEDLYLPTTGGFSSELTVDTVSIYDENITATLDTAVTQNVTANPHLIGKAQEWSWVIEVDGAMKVEVDGETLAAVAPYLDLVSFEVYTHEDVPTLIGTLTIEDLKEIDRQEVILPAKGEYVFDLTAKAKSGLNLAAGDDIITLFFEALEPEPGVEREAIKLLIESG